jgi:hypothetical protein
MKEKVVHNRLPIHMQVIGRECWEGGLPSLRSYMLTLQISSESQERLAKFFSRPAPTPRPRNCTDNFFIFNAKITPSRQKASLTPPAKPVACFAPEQGETHRRHSPQGTFPALRAWRNSSLERPMWAGETHRAFDWGIWLRITDHYPVVTKHFRRSPAYQPPPSTAACLPSGRHLLTMWQEAYTLEWI